MDLLGKLIEEQRTSGLSDRAFARRLGVSQALWSTTRSGKAVVGSKILAACAREFPELGPDILRYLANSQQDKVHKQRHGQG
jgi:transcriptional regulator with XRE-family HTH domain